jgi:alpha-glucosidase
MKRTFLLLIVLCFVNAAYTKEYKLTSPDGKIVVTINTEPDIKWSASCHGHEIINSVIAGIILENNKILGQNEILRKAVMGKVDQILVPVVANKNSRIPDKCNTLLLTFKSGFSINFRAYNDGVAYRFETSLKDTITINNEIAEDYPGMWLRGGGSGKISGTWPAYPAEEMLKSDRNLFVTKTKDYIAKTAGTRTFPWRVFIISEDDGGLIESNMVFKLAAPNRLKETDWIKPGKVAWDWWNANNIYGVDFRAGLNNDTYKYYIDFASKNGIEYVILDEGWYKLGNVLDVAPGFDIPELCKYAESRNVGIILWVVWKSFYDKIDEALDQYGKWGVKGVKVDFMQRDDQKMVDFYYLAAKKTAEHHMLIDFHGAYKPDGLGRTYPNALTREGVKGLENDKWSKDISPEHDVTIPFTRMVAGPMDYTPGAMINMDRANFQPIFTRPESQGTRVHQMALYVVFESPLQMLADSPSNYIKEQECTDFIVKVPVVWDDLKVLQAKVGDYVLLARRSGKDWFVGALTDWSPRTLEADLSFLGAGDFTIEIFQDGINADRFAQDYKHLKTNVKAGDKIMINLAPGGGWVAKISPE